MKAGRQCGVGLAVFLLTIAAGGCGVHAGDEGDLVMAEPEPVNELTPLTEFPGRLREGSPGAQEASDRAPPARAEALDEARTRALLARLPAQTDEPEDRREVALRPHSRPAPRTAVTVASEFPPAQERERPAEPAAQGPLRVLRHGPEGEIDDGAVQLSIGFDRPMIAVTSHDQAGAQVPPLRMEPAIPGQWRWLGTRTVLFEPEAPRLPMATAYTVELDAGTRAADGSTLAEPLHWQFATPPLRVIGRHPEGTGIERQPLILLEFDQAIDAQALLPLIQLRASGQRLPALRLADASEIAADRTLNARIEQEPERPRLVLRPRSPLPAATGIEVVLAAGAASAEGPRRTPSEQVFRFTTHGPFQVREHRCGWRDGCSPSDAFVLRLTNALADDIDIESLIEVEPAFAGMKVHASHQQITISGIKPGRRDYRVRLSPALRDRHGQALDGEREFRFAVGSAPAVLFVPNQSLITVDPHGPPRLSLHHINHADLRLRVQQVDAEHWGDYIRARQRNWRGDDVGVALPGRTVFDDRWPTPSEPETLSAIDLPLSPWLPDGGKGHLVLEISPGEPAHGARLSHDRTHQPRHLLWLQVTDIGLDAVSDGERLRVWTTRLDNGDALPGSRVELQPTNQAADSDSTGLTDLPLPQSPGSAEAGGPWLIARLGDDSAVLPGDEHDWISGAWQAQPRREQLRWHVFDDRNLYRPGERVHLKGWLRIAEPGPDGGLRLPEDRGRLHYRVLDARGNELLEDRTELAGLGGFDLAFDLPDTPNLGWARLALRLEGTSNLDETGHEHRFQIQEFRTPEFEVSTQLLGNGSPHLAGDTLNARVEARYYAGGGLPGAPAQWLLEATPGHYSPPGHDHWQFGFDTPWWFYRDDNGGDSVSTTWTGQTGSDGSHDLAIDLESWPQPRPLHLNLQASVQDLNRQTWTASTQTVLHPAAAYVGLKTERYFVERGQPMRIELLLVDIDGKPLPDHPVHVQAGRVQWHWRAGRYQEQLRDRQQCRVRSDDEGRARCSFDTELGGQYEITASTTDAQGRRNASRIVRWVSGGDSRPSQDTVEIEPVLFVPDRDEYAPGDIARILVQAPFADAEGLLTLARDGIAEQRRFRIDGTTTTLEVPIRSEWIANIELSVILVGRSARDGDSPTSAQRSSRPAQAVGDLTLPISRAERVLSLAVRPEQSALVPGERTRIDVDVRDADGRPVADAELALVVVDEAVLALSGYQLADPGELFYRMRPGNLHLRHLRPSLLLGSDEPDTDGADLSTEPQMVAMEMASPPPPPAPAAPPAPRAALERIEVSGSSVGAEAKADAPIDVRSDFNPLAAFVPSLRSDATGRASAQIQLPDNLTRYRIMAIAVANASHYGTGESTLTARLPLMLRPSPPRFLNFGDRFEFPLLVQNQTDAELEVELAMTAANLQFTQAQGYRTRVPANDRVELRVPMAADQAGTARYQIALASSGFADAASGELPVWTPATTEAFATYGTIDDGAVQQPVAMPEAVWPQVGGLSVTTASTAVAALTDAYLYLHAYPFECSEQVASRLLATVALRDVLAAFDVPDLPDARAIDERVRADLSLLETRLNGDGGFGLWRRGDESWPYISLHVSHALLRAQAKGYAVNQATLASALNYLRTIERRIPAWYGEWTRRHIVAYALYLRRLGGEADAAAARSLLSRVENLDELSLETVGWLLNALSDDAGSAQEQARLRRFLDNRVSETAAGAQFTQARRDGDHYILHSDRRADAVILDALIDDQPDSELIPKLVHALQAHRVRGRWGNTQDNVFVLLALDRYFQRYEAVTPDFVARTWLGERYAGEHRYRGRETTQQRVDIPMSVLAESDDVQSLLLAKDGPGRLYYRIGLDYAPRSLELAPAAHGFEVHRSYTALDDPDDVRRGDDGVWEIRAGARVAVDLQLIAPARRHHVALVDPLPAGLEAINPALAVSESPEPTPPIQPWSRQRGIGGWWPWGRWYEHQNLRSERIEAFASLLPGGVYGYRYHARATTPGDFVVPPARAEEMYEPETFGRSGSDRVRVVDRAPR